MLPPLRFADPLQARPSTCLYVIVILPAMRPVVPTAGCGRVACRMRGRVARGLPCFGDQCCVLLLCPLLLLHPLLLAQRLSCFGVCVGAWSHICGGYAGRRRQTHSPPSRPATGNTTKRQRRDAKGAQDSAAGGSSDDRGQRAWLRELSAVAPLRLQDGAEQRVRRGAV